MRYTPMKRLLHCLASILFVLGVLTVYLVFDYAVTSALPKKTKQSTNISEAILSLSNTNKFNNQSIAFKSGRSHRNSKIHINRPKPAPFHKSKTGIKINQLKKGNKQQRKLLLTTKSSSRKTNPIPI